MTSEESMENYIQIKNEINPFNEEIRKIWKIGSEKEIEALLKKERDWKKDHEQREDKARKAIIPEIGMPCTVCYYSDYHAATVTEILTSRKVKVRDNKVRCLDYYSGNYEILPELEGGEYVFTKRTNGKWILEGQKSKDGLSLQLHYQHHYIDPSF